MKLEYSGNKHTKMGVDNSDEDLKSALEGSGYASHSSSGMSVRSLGVLDIKSSSEYSKNDSKVESLYKMI